MKSRRAFFTGIVVLLAGACMCSIAFAAAPEGEAYYTKANIWYEDAEKPILVNYHTGIMIPVGTKVKIVTFKKDKMQFATESGVTLTFVNSPKYSNITLQELFDRYFSKESVAGWGGPLSRFNGKERDHIKKGTIGEGMSKEAVAMAYGYPPGHRTPSLAGDTWAYWDSRFISFLAHFQNNRLTKIERGVRRREKE